MTTRQEIQEAVRKLSAEDLESFRVWFADFDATAWDRELESDAAGGLLDSFANEALEDFKNGRCRPL